MDSIDVIRLEHLARRAYEFGRARRALLGVAPVALIVATAVLVGTRPLSVLALGLTVFALGAVMLWYGRALQKAVLPGISAGLVPLAFALCASRIHVCGPDGCSSLCVPACTLGGVLAGLAIAGVGRRRGVGFWVPASGLALLTGAMGCACMGYSGVVGLGLGFGVGVVPAFLYSAFGTNRR